MNPDYIKKDEDKPPPAGRRDSIKPASIIGNHKKRRYFEMLRFIMIIFLFCPVFLPAKSLYRVNIHGTIDIGLATFIERIVEQANSEKPAAILFDINTFGGRIDAATRIKDAILSAKPQTIVYVNRRAISAGALISMACDRIVMAPGSSIGAATAVDISGKKVSEKVQSFMRSEMRSTAEKTGRNVRIAEAMVDERIQIEGLTDSTTLVTLTAGEALKWGIADTIATSLDDLLKIYDFEDAEIQLTTITWSERIVRFLTDPIVSSLLMTLGFLGLLFEIKSPGWGIPGTVGLICLALFFSSSIIAQLASITEILIFLAGLGLLILEWVAIPGFGIAGIAGIGLMIWGVFMMLIGEYPTPQEINRALWGVGIAILAFVAVLIIILKNLPKTSLWRRLTLGAVLRKDMGVKSTVNAEDLIGQEGITISNLRPAGKMLIGERKLDVVSEGAFIPKNSQVKIIQVVGNRVIVRPLTEEKKS